MEGRTPQQNKRGGIYLLWILTRGLEMERKGKATSLSGQVLLLGLGSSRVYLSSKAVRNIHFPCGVKLKWDAKDTKEK